MGGAPPDYTKVTSTLGAIMNNTKSASTIVIVSCSIRRSICVLASGKAGALLPDSIE